LRKWSRFLGEKMKQKKINYLRQYYQLGLEISDSQLADILPGSFGDICFGIFQAKKQLSIAILNSFPELKRIINEKGE